jgi:hypothetical protein
MLGTIILATVTIIGTPAADLPAERLDSGYCDNTMYWSERHQEWEASPFGPALPCVPAECAPTFCEDGVTQADGSLLCLDTDEVFPAGHWAYAIGPDQGDLQVVVEY